jgi:hypothetical protein
MPQKYVVLCYGGNGDVDVFGPYQHKGDAEAYRDQINRECREIGGMQGDVAFVYPLQGAVWCVREVKVAS